MDDLVKIFLCEGGDVELGAQPQNISLCLRFDPLSLTLSLILCLALIHIVHIIYMLGFICVPYLC